MITPCVRTVPRLLQAGRWVRGRTVRRLTAIPARTAAALARLVVAAALFACGAATGVAWDSFPPAVGPHGAAVVQESGSGGVGGREDASPAFRARYQALRQAELRAAEHASRVLASIPTGIPVQGRLTSSYTSRRVHPILQRVRPHWGVDIAAPLGAPVMAGADGRVLAVATNPSYGLVVDVSHRGGEYITRYAHLSAVMVREGEAVKRGQPIGRVGSTGLSTGPHLHYEIFVHGRRRDPALLFEADAALGLLP